MWQPAALLFPDVELVVADRLRPLLNPTGDQTVFVASGVPPTQASGRRKRMVVVNRDGGNVANGTDRARVRVRVWDDKPQDANDLARRVVALMQRLVDGSPVVRVEHLSGPIEITDTQEQRYLLFEVHTQGVAA